MTNLLRIYSALSGEPVAALEAKYAGAGYGGFKKDLAELVVATLRPDQGADPADPRRRGRAGPRCSPTARPVPARSPGRPWRPSASASASWPPAG